MSESQEPETQPEAPSAPHPAPPSRARIWFLVSCFLFLVWIGVLGFLAATTAEPIVLSRPQLLVSTLDVIAAVDQGDDGKPRTTVRIKEVHWPPAEAQRVGTTLEVANLADAQGWHGPGDYILPLVEKDGAYQVAWLPKVASPIKDPRPRIYPLTPETRSQLEAIRKPEPAKQP